MKKDLTKLTELQHHVTQENGTEPPFTNEYNDFFEEGLYLDIVSNEVLFSSKHKFASPCGWPAFYKSIAKENLKLVEDMTHGLKRVEVRSKLGDSHLGHVFNDGPAPTGVRYCINSASLKFIPKKDLKTENLSEYIAEFEQEPESKKPVKRAFATVGAGCFWGVEALFKELDGVLNVTSGYCGGKTLNPTYEDICTGQSGHAEVVQVEFNENVLSFENLLTYFFRLHDPTTLNSQGYDIGTQYRSVIFFHSQDQEQIARDLIQKITIEKKYKNPIVTEITKFETFYSAEEYHQDYYEKKYSGGHGPICHILREE